MIEFIFGNESAEKVLLHVFHYGEIHAAAIAVDYNIAVTPLRLQLERFERGGLLKAKSYGRLRVFSFNEKNVWTKPVLEILKIAYNSIPLEEKEKIFSERRRPRLKGKPVIK
jgi:hypothetical protein